MRKRNNIKRGFSLIELSIGLVVLGLLILGIISGRKIIDNARSQSIMDEVNKYKTVINQFVNVYGGLPGDIIKDRIGGALISDTHYHNAANAGARTIKQDAILDAFKQLSRENLVSAIDDSATTGYRLSDGTETEDKSIYDAMIAKHIPLSAPSSGKSVWLLAHTDEYGPFEARGVNGWKGKNRLRLILGGSQEKCARPVTPASNSMTAGMAYRMDLKFDDGLPYGTGGNIIAGKYTVASGATGASCATVSLAAFAADSGICNTGVTTETTIAGAVADTGLIADSIKYVDNASDMTKGCIMSFMVDYSVD